MIARGAGEGRGRTHSINLDNYDVSRNDVQATTYIRMAPITFSFLPFCIHTRIRPRSRSRPRSGNIRYTYFLRTRRYVTVHTLLSRSTYMGFFSRTPYDPPCRLYNSNLGSFLSRIIGYTLFCARFKVGGMARGRFGIFSPWRK